jgi:hypothetical protein
VNNKGASPYQRTVAISLMGRKAKQPIAAIMGQIPLALLTVAPRYGALPLAAALRLAWRSILGVLSVIARRYLRIARRPSFRQHAALHPASILSVGNAPDLARSERLLAPTLDSRCTRA